MGTEKTREMVISGYRGWKRRLQRRKEQSGMVYRSAESSLALRTKTKLTGKETWYKDQKRDCNSENEDNKTHPDTTRTLTNRDKNKETRDSVTRIYSNIRIFEY